MNELENTGLALRSSIPSPQLGAWWQQARLKLKPMMISFCSLCLPPVFGFVLLLLVWQGAAWLSPGLPTPFATLQSALELFADPFYVKGPNDQGIGWNVLASLVRVGLGFGLAALCGIPLGFLIGRWSILNGISQPVIALLRPVSPLAWLPIGLLVFKAAHPASIYVIFISSIWPLIINTAMGVKQIPEDYLNLAKVLNLSEWKIFSKILLPATIPHILTGVRLSVGTAWLVIVAAEMLTGGVGLGFWIWDEWNNLNMEHIIIAIFIIGVIGFALESTLLYVGKRLNYSS